MPKVKGVLHKIIGETVISVRRATSGGKTGHTDIVTGCPMRFHRELADAQKEFTNFTPISADNFKSGHPH
jgi:hypothetical protein